MFSVVIVAAGNASRAKLGYNKIFYPINGKYLIEYSVDYFLKDNDFKEIIIVVSKNDLQRMRSLFSNSKIKYVIGGSSRQKSVFNGLSLVNEEFVMIHDSARPNLKSINLNYLKESTIKNDACILFIPVRDSVIEYNKNRILKYLNRSNIGLIQTPQAFKTKLIKKAHSFALKKGNNYTDDASLYIKELNKEVTLILGDEMNIKATTQIDFTFLEEIL